LATLSRRIGEGDPDRAILERGERSIQRVRRIIDGLLAFARAGAQPEPGAHADVRAVIDDLAGELGPAAHDVCAELLIDPFGPCTVAAS
ncbi:hypothetical protein NL533_32025, partial [Klebsiella pneumoniae]|nr:hypothetical protein [Klebsiella pneumoniae]